MYSFNRPTQKIPDQISRALPLKLKKWKQTQKRERKELLSLSIRPSFQDCNSAYSTLKKAFLRFFSSSITFISCIAFKLSVSAWRIAVTISHCLWRHGIVSRFIFGPVKLAMSYVRDMTTVRPVGML